jgi:hypothetical protein
VIQAYAQSISAIWVVGTPMAGACLIMGECQDDVMASRKFIARYLVRVTQLMFVSLALFLQHYTLKSTVVKAEDVENAGVLELDQINGEEDSEERTNKPSNDNGDDDDIKIVGVDKKRTLEGHEVVIMRLPVEYER